MSRETEATFFDYLPKLRMCHELHAPQAVHQLLRALTLWACQPENERSVVVDGEDAEWLLDPPRAELAAVAGVTERTVRRWFRALRSGAVSVPYLSADWRTYERHAFLIRWCVVRDLLGRRAAAAEAVRVPRDISAVSPGTLRPPGGGHPVRVPRDTLSPDRGGQHVPRDHKASKQETRSITTTTNQAMRAVPEKTSRKGLGISIQPDTLRRAEGWRLIWTAACRQGFAGCDADSPGQRRLFYGLLANLRRQTDILNKPGFLVSLLNAGPDQWALRPEPQDLVAAERAEQAGQPVSQQAAPAPAAAGRTDAGPVDLDSLRRLKGDRFVDQWLTRATP